MAGSRVVEWSGLDPSGAPEWKSKTISPSTVAPTTVCSVAVSNPMLVATRPRVEWFGQERRHGWGGDGLATMKGGTKMNGPRPRNRFSRLTRAVLIGSLVLAAPALTACEGSTDAISDQVDQQVDGLRDQVGDAALDQLNEATGGKVEDLQQTQKEALEQIEQAREEANRAVRKARRQAEQVRQEALSPAE